MKTRRSASWRGDAYAAIAGGDRSAFDRITLRPRMMVPVLDLNLSVTLFGQTLFAPILVAPIAQQTQFHPDGERATVTGASAARAVTVVSSDSSVPLAELVRAARPGRLVSGVCAGPPRPARGFRTAVKAGCAAICVTLGAPPAAKGARPVASTVKADLAALDALRRRVDVPVLVKGIATPDEAKLALQHDVQGIIVSNYRGPAAAGQGRVDPDSCRRSSTRSAAGRRCSSTAASGAAPTSSRRSRSARKPC